MSAIEVLGTAHAQILCILLLACLCWVIPKGHR